MSESSVQDVIKAVLDQLNWSERGISTHTLRHCYATHLLEAGVSLKLIQKYLGHKHLTSTMNYLHITTVGEEAAIVKINILFRRKNSLSASALNIMCQNTSMPQCSAGDNHDKHWTINDILRQFGPAYLKKFGSQMSQDQLKALRALQRCRQPEAGSVMYHCQTCNKVHHVPKACVNRHCPSCQGDKARNWLAQQQDRLLPCAYFMLTFTVPSQLRRFVRSHPKECYRALMVRLSVDGYTWPPIEGFMGSSNIGATGVLHTWGRDMNYHPHVHFIVPGGALSKSGGQWLPSRANYFVSVLALSKISELSLKT